MEQSATHKTLKEELEYRAEKYAAERRWEAFWRGVDKVLSALEVTGVALGFVGGVVFSRAGLFDQAATALAFACFFMLRRIWRAMHR